MVYIIVEFNEDSSTEVVPKQWLVDGNCPWDDSKLFQMEIKRGGERPTTYNLFAARQVGVYESGE